MLIQGHNSTQVNNKGDDYLLMKDKSFSKVLVLNNQYDI